MTLNSSPLSSYVYDTNGNKTQVTYSGSTVNATYNTSDQLLTYGTKSYSYNLNGELSDITDSSSIPAGSTSYTYDVFGNLKSVTIASSTTYTYLYDGMNRRVGKKVGSTLSQQFTWWNDLRIAAEYDGAGTLVAEFIYGDKINVPDYIVKGGINYKVITNHLGSVVAVVESSTGTIAQQITYDDFGRILSDSSPGFQPFGFAGGLYDNDTKLTHFGARDYDVETGRWMSKDPILFGGGDTNLYGYVLNDPVNFIDPNGLGPIADVIVTISCYNNDGIECNQAQENKRIWDLNDFWRPRAPDPYPGPHPGPLPGPFPGDFPDPINPPPGPRLQQPPHGGGPRYWYPHEKNC